MGETLSVQRQGSDSTQSHVHMHDSEDCTGQQGHSWVGSTVLHWQAESFLAGKEHSVWSVFPCLLCPEGYFLLREAKGHRGHLFAADVVEPIRSVLRCLNSELPAAQWPSVASWRLALRADSSGD